ncbi:E3 ubiquitin-protein ligase PPP1R11 [Castor canadensis]|uniref:E3 ubiquitin-protein ligase PPP1R11 n=2 Tax=Castor canadensis TaxID=51338 RepID=A0A8C0WGJ0_CASCN
MRHTRKWEAGSGVGQVIPSGEAEALEEGEKKQAEDLGYYSESDTDSPRTQRHGKREGRLIPPFLPASFFPALAMAEAGAGLSETVTETTVTVTTEPENRSLTIKLRKRKPEKKVEWTSDTVDNEHMGRRSSKCCCIYEKPRAFGESSTESEEEEEGCGHTHCVRGHRKGRRPTTPGPIPTTPPQPPDPSQPPPGPMQH